MFSVMVGVAFVWLLLSTFVSFTTGTERRKIQASGPSVCEAEASLSSTELHAATEIFCAMLCAKRMAKGYTFSGTSCTLFGESSQPVSSSNTFFHFPLPDVLEDIATGKEAYASSTYNGDLTPDKAVDTIETDNSLFATTGTDMSPWWLLKLGETRIIHEIQIISRTDCCSERFHDVEIRVGENFVDNGDFSSYTLFATYKGPYTKTQGRLSCLRRDGVPGKFVSIKKVKTNAASAPLQIVDVNVFVIKEN